MGVSACAGLSCRACPRKPQHRRKARHTPWPVAVRRSEPDMSTVIVSELSDGAYDDKYDYKGDHVLMIMIYIICGH